MPLDERKIDGIEELLKGNRLFEEVDCSLAKRLFGGFDRSVSRHDDDRELKLVFPIPLFEKFKTVHPRHPNVKKYHGVLVILHKLLSFLCIGRRCYVMSRLHQNFGEDVAYAEFVVDYEDVCHTLLRNEVDL